jgi:hypothetical protein
MSEPNSQPGKNGTPDDKKESESILKILDELLSHTNSSRRLFLVFIASALFFGPVALILGGVLLGHPEYNIRHLEPSQVGDNFTNMHHIAGMHIQVVDQNGTVVRELPMMPFPGGDRPHVGPIFFGLRIFITISIIFAVILLFIAIKEYRFFSHWNKKFTKYKALKDKVDKELDEE